MNKYKAGDKLNGFKISPDDEFHYVKTGKRFDMKQIFALEGDIDA